jgi:hypothetical protein
MPGIVHVDERSEEVEGLLGHVGDRRRPLARAEVLGAPADLDDLVAAIQPRRMTVVGDFSVRGGIKTVVTATYQKGGI